MRKLIILALIFLAFIPLSYQTNIYSCQTINSPGYYKLSTDIYERTSTCFYIRSNDVILDCDNHIIDGNKGWGDYGIRTYNYQNITIKNCNIQQFDRGIYVYYGRDIKIINTNISDNRNYGLYLYRPNTVTLNYVLSEGTNNRDGLYATTMQNLYIYNSVFRGNTRYAVYLRSVNNGELYNNLFSGSQRGIYLYTSNGLEIHHNHIENNDVGIYTSSAGNNEENWIYDNYFFNPTNFQLAGTKYYNKWYDEPHLGDGIKWNIIAGNYWAKPDGTGYSQTCQDLDENGICDQEYVLGTDNIDVFPISNVEPQLQDWWNDDWAYRQKIKVIGNLVDNYPIYIEVNTASMILAGKLRPDCGDLRFVEQTPLGFTELSYFIVNNTCNSVATRIYVKIPHKSTEYIFMYYGNPTATSQSNGESTFLFFDDFETFNTTKWEVLNNNFTVEGGLLTVFGQDETKVIRSYYQATEPYIIEYYAMPSYDDTSVDWDAGIGITFDDTNYLFFTDDPAGTGLAVHGYDDNFWRSVDYIANRWQNDILHRYKVAISSYTSIYYDMDDGRYNQDDSDRHTGGKIAFVIDEDDPNKQNDLIVDVVMIYPYIDEEPSLLFYSEENRNDYPYVRLLTPEHQTITTNDTITFKAIATDLFSSTMQARLYIFDKNRDLYYRSDWITISNNTEFSFSYSLGTGKWYWNVEVDDQDSVAPKRAMAYEDYILWKDGALPSIQILTPLNTTYPTNQINLTTNATDDLIIRECFYSINNLENITYDCFADIIQAVEGNNCLRVWAVDLANNTATDSVCFTSDTDPPYWKNLKESPPEPIEDDLLSVLNLSIEWYADIYPISYVLLEFDGANYTPQTNGTIYWYEFSGLEPKIYNYTWYARDTAGRFNISQNSYVVCDIRLDVNVAFNPIYHNTFQIVRVNAYYDATDNPMPNATITLRIYDPDNNLIDEETKMTDENGVATFNIFLSQDLKTGFYIAEAEGISPEGFTTDSPTTEVFQLVSVGLANPLTKINDGNGLYYSKINSEGNYTIKVEVINPSSTNTIERAIVKVLLPIDTNPQQYPEGDVIRVYDTSYQELPFMSDFNEYNMPYIYFIIYNLTANERRTYYVDVYPRLCEYVECQENKSLLEINAQYNLFIENILKNLQLNITFDDNNIISRIDDLEAVILSHIDQAVMNITNNITATIYQAKAEINGSIYDTYLLLKDDIDNAVVLINSNTNLSRNYILNELNNLRIYLEANITDSRDLILYTLNNNQQEILYYLNSNFTTLNSNIENYYRNLYDFINATNQSNYQMYLVLKSDIANLNTSLTNQNNIIIQKLDELNSTLIFVHQDLSYLIQEHNQSIADLINSSKQDLLNKLSQINQDINQSIAYAVVLINNNTNDKYILLNNLIDEKLNNISLNLIIHNETIKNMLNNISLTINDSEYRIISFIDTKHLMLNETLNYLAENIKQNITAEINNKYSLLEALLNTIISKLNNISIDIATLQSQLTEINNNILSLNSTIISEFNTLHNNLAQNFTYIDLYLSYLNDNMYSNFTSVNAYLDQINSNIANNFTQTNLLISQLDRNLYLNYTYFDYLIRDSVSNLTLAINSINTTQNQNKEDIIQAVVYANQTIHDKLDQLNETQRIRYENILQNISALNQTEQYRFLTILDNILSLNQTEQERYLSILDKIDILQNNITIQLILLNETEEAEHQEILNKLAELQNNITQQFITQNSLLESNFTLIREDIAEINGTLINMSYLLSLNFSYINETLININQTQNYNYLQLKALIEATSNDIKNNFTELINTLNISIDDVLYAYFNCEENKTNQICDRLENIRAKSIEIRAITSEIREILIAQAEVTEAYGIITEENENELKAYIYVKGNGNTRPVVKLYLPCKADKNDITLTDMQYNAFNFNIYKDLSGRYYIEFTARLDDPYDTETYKLLMKKTYCELPTEYNIRPIYIQLQENKGLLEYIRDIIVRLQERIDELKLIILSGGRVW